MLSNREIRISFRWKVDLNKGLKEGRMVAQLDEKPEQRPEGGNVVWHEPVVTSPSVFDSPVLVSHLPCKRR